MGIPGLFGRFISKNARNAIIETINNVSSLSIDLNSLLHAAFSKIYMESILEKGEGLVKEGKARIALGKKLKKTAYGVEGNELIEQGETMINSYKEGLKLYEKGERLLGKDEKRGRNLMRIGTDLMNEKVYMKRLGKSEDLIDKLEKDFHVQVWKLIMDVLGAFDEVDTLILAIDGVAPGAKLKQQRQRRFKSALNNDAMINFDSNAITPGTDFMIRLDEFLEQSIKKEKHKLPRKVIYSSHLVEGEGEGKILNYYRTGQVQEIEHANHVLYGLDADLIMLSLLSPLDNIVLYRDASEGADILSINLLKEYLQKQMGGGKVLQDFVIMTFLLGNDFVPHNLALVELAETIEMMMDIYVQHKFHFTKKDNSLNFEQLQQFFAILASQEGDLLTDIANNEHYFSKALNESKAGDALDIGKYRKKYYRKILGNDVTNDKIKHIVVSYLRTLSWNYLYYQEGMNAINHDWVYPYYYAPMLADLALYSKDVIISGYTAYDGMTKFNPLHQLLSVLPKTSIHIVPEIIQPYHLIESPIYDIFPSTFVNDHDGKIPVKKPGKPMMDHGIALIPIPDRSRIELLLFNTPLEEQWEEKEDLIITNKKPEKTTYHKMETYAARQMNYQPRNDLQPRGQKQQYQHHNKQIPVYQSQKQYQPVQKQPYATQKQYQPVQKQPYPTQNKSQKQYQPVQKQPQKQYQPVQTQSSYPTQNKYQLNKQPISLQPSQPSQPSNDILPELLDVNKLKSYILTGKIPKQEPTKKSAMELLNEAEWY